MRPRDTKTQKDIDKLKKFLYRNQEYRFSDKEQTYLFQAVQSYAHAFISQPVPDSPALPLVEDALKMPFTVFSTSHKKTLIKLLDKLNGLESADPSAAAAATAAGSQQQRPQQQYTVLDVSAEKSTAEVMDDDGETLTVALAGVCEPGLVDALLAAWEGDEGSELRVLLGSRHGQQAITKLLLGPR